jgi:predicted TIM-barrel fold metal-dependent hydrolase
MAGDLGQVIDVHHHWLPIEIIDSIERYVRDGYRVVREGEGFLRIFDSNGSQVFTVNREAYSSISRRLEYMDAAGIDVALLSSACFPMWMTLEAARVINDAATDVLRDHGARLVPMVHVPPFGEDGILEEMERGARLGFRGVTIATNFKGLYPDAEQYLPFLRKAAELDLPVFVHAAGAPVHDEGLRDYGLVRSLGRSLEHCLVTVRLLYSGVLADIPGLRMVMPHLGGAFFSNVKRFLDRPAEQPRVPLDSLRGLLDQLQFDTAPSFWYGPIEIECAVKNLGANRVALGSDYPAHPASADAAVLKNAVEHIRALGIPDTDKRRIAGENTREFFGL